MGLVGRLGDLPVSDIIQIVYLSRGSGVLHVQMKQERYTLVFQKGLLVNASSPRLGPIGAARSPAALGRGILERVSAVVAELREKRGGEFEFVSGEVPRAQIGYEPREVFKRAGLRPEDLFGKGASGLQSLTSVKEALKGGTNRVVSTQPVPPAKVPDRFVVLIDDSPDVRKAVRTAANLHGFGLIETTVETAVAKVSDLLSSQKFFIIAVSLGDRPASAVFPLVRGWKQRNPRLSIVALDRTSDYRRRHQAFDAGADAYMRKPLDDAEDELIMFEEDLLLHGVRRCSEHQALTASEQSEPMKRGFRFLLDLMKQMNGPDEVSQISLTILQLAADYVDRAALFALKGDQFVALGRFGVPNNGAERLALGQLPIFDRVAETREAFRGPVDAPTARQLQSVFGAADVRQAVVLPMLSGDKVIGLLYGDDAVNHRPVDDALGLEVFLSQAGFAFQQHREAALR